MKKVDGKSIKEDLVRLSKMIGLLFICVFLQIGCLSIIGSLVLPADKIVLTRTPLTDIKMIANENNPQAVAVGEFVDVRETKTVGVYVSETPGMAGTQKKMQVSNDVPTVVREAFIDGFTKSGFKVIGQGETGASPVLYLTGKIKMMVIASESRGLLKGYNTIARIVLELKTVDKDGKELVFDLDGKYINENGSYQVYPPYVSPGFDGAINDAVKKLLADERIFNILSQK